jgi:hypothetical protein
MEIMDFKYVFFIACPCIWMNGWKLAECRKSKYYAFKIFSLPPSALPFGPCQAGLATPPQLPHCMRAEGLRL